MNYKNSVSEFKSGDKVFVLVPQENYVTKEFGTFVRTNRVFNDYRWYTYATVEINGVEHVFDVNKVTIGGYDA